MEFANHLYQEEAIMDGGKLSPDVIAPRKSSLANNFSYPRPEPERQLRRHESSESRSSLTSDGSMPGMTDSSDSETSFEEDINYNTSASELWDSFWPDNTTTPGEQYPVLLRASQAPNYFTKSFPKHQSQETDDTITISKIELDSKLTAGSSCGTLVPQPSPPRPATRNGPPTYSVYPKLEPPKLHRVPLPPRTSSLLPAPVSPPRRQVVKPAKSSAQLRQSKSSHSLKRNAMSSVAKIPMPPMTSNSVPVSPAYPPPPPPRALRSTSSAINLRDKKSSPNQNQHNTAVPLSPLSTMIATPLPEPRSSSRPEFERYVSVFEIDSDHESHVGSSSFTKRIARGFHKKSASEKRSGNDRRGSEDSNAHDSEKEKEKESPSRKRGGSLGRILGLRSR
ncbi:uncharacterized protein F4822DRAFT_110246 [Hypoxylon trugodes]|uniref:uncharacterized protein n=1 Tax=Hypoxylon trugodes TaxID=326681 RepID=UPI002195E6CD|nr:uncharacterized protein F4822DRAFT_110246 [Hypoxylon trugodes]KAI1391953.1 hypothetical protein F4822DRAFT_110246 [Hypoxylon trugodes]